MPIQLPPLEASAAMALAISRVGTWEYDVQADRFRCDAMTAGLYGLTMGEGEQGVPRTRTRAAIHPEDRPRVIAAIERAIQDGGLFVLEFRTHAGMRSERRLLIRGCYETGASGRTGIGRGIAMDVTDNYSDGSADRLAPTLAVGLEAEVMGSLNGLTGHALKARQIILAIGEPTNIILRLLNEAMLIEIGRHLATQAYNLDEDGQTPGGRSDRRH